MTKTATNKRGKKYKEDDVCYQCRGLKNGEACQDSSGQAVNACDVEKKDGPFYCPDCLSGAAVHKCAEKADYFSHSAKLTTIVGSRETELHKECKDKIREALTEAYPDGEWVSENSVAINSEQGYSHIRRPDISGNLYSNKIALEIQNSTYTIDKIVRRIADYSAQGYAIIWIIPLKKN